jgi:hypothetical protein
VLDRSTVLEAALALVDGDGKESLLDGLVETALSKLEVDQTDTDWRAQLHQFATDFRQVVLSHPRVLPLIATRPLAVPLARGTRSVLRRDEALRGMPCSPPCRSAPGADPALSVLPFPHL